MRFFFFFFFFLDFFIEILLLCLRGIINDVSDLIFPSFFLFLFFFFFFSFLIFRMVTLPSIMLLGRAKKML